ncbi:hypothetical protein EJB05_29154, partial [Eragrostis curvula]
MSPLQDGENITHPGLSRLSLHTDILLNPQETMPGHQKPGGSQHPRLAKEELAEMFFKSVFYVVDRLLNFPGWKSSDADIFSERTGLWTYWTDIPPLEEKVAQWTSEHPVIWNVGIGPTASFVKTLTRLLFERTKDLYYGPSDHIIRVGPPNAAAAGSCTGPRWLALEVLMEVSRTLEIPLPAELTQLAEEQNFYGYGTISDNLMVKPLGWRFLDLFEPDLSTNLDHEYSSQPDYSQVQSMIRDAQKGKRFLLLVENLHFPVSPSILVFVMWKRPSLVNNRWLISTTSKNVYNSTRQLQAPTNKSIPTVCNVGPECYYSLPFDDLLERDWAVLTKEALRDATRSIYNALQQQRDEEFWLHAAQHCLYYSILYHHPLEGASKHEESTTTTTVSSDELVRCWVAEGLLSSITSPFDIPSGTDKKQSNHYSRSAYEVGRIVFHALQEYSLLPVYPDSAPTDSPAVSSSQDAVTALSKLAEDVPRLKQAELSDGAKSDRLRWVSFMNDDGRHVSWDWRDRRNAEFLPGERTISTLILRGCSDISGFPFDKVLNHRLRVLDLSYTMIDSLPPWLSLLLNLLLLSLRGCSKLNKLSPPQLNSSEGDKTPALANLGNLQVLDMNGVPLLELTQQDGSNKSNLHYLDLSGSRVITLPSEFFGEMSSLEELILGNCSNLKGLPLSLAKLTNLLILHVEGTQIICFPEDIFIELQRLRTLKLINNKLLLSLPVSLSKANGLKQLHIYNCISLKLQYILEQLLPLYLEDLDIKGWEGLEVIEIHGHPNLTVLSFSGTWIRCLSLRGCRKLKTFNCSNDITALESVDLSGTAIEEVPHNLPNQPQLNMLILLNVPSLKRFPWHVLARFPKVFCLDHSADDDSQFLKMFRQKKICAGENQHTEIATNTAQISVNDSRIFHSFNANAVNKLVKKGSFLESFNVHVKPCSVRAKEPQNKKIELCTNITRPSPYHDVRYSEAASIVSMMKLQPRQRHVEISAEDRYPHGLRQLLSVTHSIFLRDDAFVMCLTDLNSSLMSLEECQLQNCHEMKVIFKMNSKGTVEFDYWGRRIESLEVSPIKILQASSLKNLRSFVEPSDLSKCKLISLKLLQHIHLENCPRLEKMFPCGLSLPALESLVILFCTNLKTIFYQKPEYEVAPSPLPNIQRIYLQELPQLQHIHDDVMLSFETPKWESLFVRGCQSFQRLPLLRKEYPMSEVKVSGERVWWQKLRWIPEQSNYYLQVPPPEFASRKKDVVIKTYLR